MSSELKSINDLEGVEQITVQCIIAKDDPEICDGYEETFELAEPAYFDDRGKIHFPGVRFECDDCHQTMTFEINGVGVLFE